MAASTHGLSRRQRGAAGVLRLYRVTPHHLFELATAIVFALVGLAWMMEPAQTGQRSPVGAISGAWPWTWAILYLVALPLITYGVMHSNRIRVAGLLLLGTGLLMHFVAALTGPIEPRTFGYFVFSLACVLRALLLIKLTPRR